jgi:hypothetical protein
VVGEKEYPEGFGNTKKEAKEEAAMQVYLELCGRSQTTGVRVIRPHRRHTISHGRII